MTTKRALVRLILGCAAVAVLLGGCSGCGEDEKTAPAPSTQAAGKQATQKPAATPPAPAAKPRPTPTAPAAEESNDPTVALRNEIEMPSYFPDDAPVYPGSRPSHAELTDGTRATVMFGTDSQPEDVIGYMESNVPSMGWTVLGSQSIPGGSLIQASKRGRFLLVVVSRLEASRADAITMIAVTVDR